ncbi:hypothetical protein RvY_06123 [Ramazzottius varieornatus]|uniref:Uncharacterized protein n=1 Tax=Ramazzottius varieornatus TaxID=947166 RepID=A0A1D1UXY2_RAMVA|nr:hypothetical protein RvY_06123 [Ramazzottius varieornatus]
MTTRLWLPPDQHYFTVHTLWPTNLLFLISRLFLFPLFIRVNLCASFFDTWTTKSSPALLLQSCCASCLDFLLPASHRHKPQRSSSLLQRDQSIDVSVTFIPYLFKLCVLLSYHLHFLAVVWQISQSSFSLIIPCRNVACSFQYKPPCLKNTHRACLFSAILCNLRCCATVSIRVFVTKTDSHAFSTESYRVFL